MDILVFTYYIHCFKFVISQIHIHHQNIHLEVIRTCVPSQVRVESTPFFFVFGSQILKHLGKSIAEPVVRSFRMVDDRIRLKSSRQMKPGPIMLTMFSFESNWVGMSVCCYLGCLRITNPQVENTRTSYTMERFCHCADIKASVFSAHNVCHKLSSSSSVPLLLISC
jgi:hypothetical protein